MKALIIIAILVIPANILCQAQEMVQVGDILVDKFEAPNIEGQSPFVMFTYNEAKSWCESKGKRLLTDSEWETVAGGPQSYPYVYGQTYDSSICNDDKTWILPDQGLLNYWPVVTSLNSISTFSQLIDTVMNISTNAALSANHVMSLYQAETSGSNTGCISYYGVYDLNGNISEWTTRHDGGSPSFHGNLKGGYWSGPATIQTGITTHGDNFRYYQTGFRCAKDSAIITGFNRTNIPSPGIYPVPVHSVINIKYDFHFPITVNVSSVYGTPLKSMSMENNPVCIDISSFPAGIYFISMTDNSGMFYVEKIIKY